MHPVSRVLVCLSTFVIVSHATSPMTTTSRDNTWSTLTAVDLSTLLPLTWRSMCRAKHISLFDDVNIIISCHRTVEDNVHWRLDDLNVSLEPVVMTTRTEVRILFFTRAHVMLPCGRPLMTSDLCPEKKYDAFVSYAHQDCEWVTQTLCHRLEHTISPTYDRPLKLCIHQRDFIVGKPIIDNIIDCIAASRHTIIVLTPSFVQSSWAMEELQQAFRQSMEERRRHLLLVVLETVPQSDMAPVLRRCCKTFTYLEVSHALFWDRLVYSLHADVGKFPKLKTNQENGFDNVITIEDNIGTENGDSKDLDSSWSADHLGRRLPPSMHVETMRTVSVDSTSTVSTTISDDAFSMN